MIKYGKKIDRLPFGTLCDREDLLYYNGPLLSLLKSDNGDNVVFYWCESDSNLNRWLVFKVVESKAQLLRDDVIGINELIEDCASVYLVDIDTNLNYHEIREVSPYSIPPSYLPKPSRLPEDILPYSVFSPKPSNFSAVTSFMSAIPSPPSVASFFEFDDLTLIRPRNVNLSAYHIA